MTGCIVFGSPVDPITTLPPATGCSDGPAEALVEGPPVGAHAVAISVNTVRAAMTTRGIPCCRTLLLLS